MSGQSGPLKVVFFDVGGTLIAPSPSLAEIYGRVLAPLGLRSDTAALRRASIATWAEFDALVGRGGDRYGHFPGGEMEYWGRYVRRVLEHVAEEHLAEEATAALHQAFSDAASWAVFPDAWDTLRGLKERGIRVGVISNWDSRLKRLLEQLGLAPAFESIVVSCEIGAEKPAAAIFEHALREMRVEASESLHVGDDRVSDYEGARAAGMQAALIVRNGAPFAGAQSSPVAGGQSGSVAGGQSGSVAGAPGTLTADLRRTAVAGPPSGSDSGTIASLLEIVPLACPDAVPLEPGSNRGGRRGGAPAGERPGEGVEG